VTTFAQRLRVFIRRRRVALAVLATGAAAGLVIVALAGR
jgi:hypothetical protein